jgi:hypothetical protein
VADYDFCGIMTALTSSLSDPQNLLLRAVAGLAENLHKSLAAASGSPAADL